MKHVKVGFYDQNGKLVETDDTEMIVPNGQETFASVPGKKVAKKGVTSKSVWIRHRSSLV